MQIGHINISSLRHKLFVVRKLVQDYCLDVLAVTETWLDSSVLDSEVSLDGFTLFRKDRTCSPYCSCSKDVPCSKHGGVVIYARTSLGFVQDSGSTDERVESLWLRSHKRTRKQAFFLGCVYRPPSESSAYWEILADTMAKLQGEGIVLVGDLNVDFMTPGTSSFANLKNHILLPYDLTNHITVPTRLTPASATAFDCILSNMDSVSHGNAQDCEHSDHRFIHTVISLQSSLDSRTTSHGGPHRDFS